MTTIFLKNWKLLLRIWHLSFFTLVDYIRCVTENLGIQIALTKVHFNNFALTQAWKFGILWGSYTN